MEIHAINQPIILGEPRKRRWKADLVHFKKAIAAPVSGSFKMPANGWMAVKSGGPLRCIGWMERGQTVALTPGQELYVLAAFGHWSKVAVG